MTTYCVAGRELVAGPWAMRQLDAQANKLLATPNGVFVFGDREIAYLDHASGAFKRAPVAAGSETVAVCELDARRGRWLVADRSGRISCAMLNRDTQTPTLQSKTASLFLIVFVVSVESVSRWCLRLSVSAVSVVSLLSLVSVSLCLQCL